MKKSIIVLIAYSVLVFGCSTDSNTKNAVEWIRNARKPITVKWHSMNGWTTNYRYTLIDADGNVYVCGETELALPDTIWGCDDNLTSKRPNP